MITATTVPSIVLVLVSVSNSRRFQIKVYQMDISSRLERCALLQIRQEFSALKFK